MKSCLLYKNYLLALLLCCIYAAAGNDRDPRNEFLNYAVVKPTIWPQSKAGSHPHLAQVLDEERLALEFEAFDKTFVLDLMVNGDLFSENYVITHQKNGEEVVYQPLDEKEKKCYYKGHVSNVKNSWAAISTCRGISGMIFDGTEVFYIEPDTRSLIGEHLVFKESERKERNGRCGADLFDIPSFRHLPHNQQSAEDSWSPKYIEAAVIIDHSMYKKYNKSVIEVSSRSNQIVNGANVIYSPLNISISIQKTEVWSTEDEVSVTSDARTTLYNFLKYRKDKMLPIQENDNTMFLTNKDFPHPFGGRILGIARMEGMCQKDYSGVLTSDYTAAVGAVSIVFAHELGHNLGMDHDDELDDCVCPKTHCVMYSQATSDAQNNWSSCSTKALQEGYDSGRFKCLENRPGTLHTL